jgi:phosphopantetheine adenylyltransferase
MHISLLLTLLLTIFLTYSNSSPLPKMSSIGILISLAKTRFPDASHSHLINQSITPTTRTITIYVELDPKLLSAPHLASWKSIQRILSGLYLAASRKTYGMDLPFIEVDGISCLKIVVLLEWCGYVPTYRHDIIHRLLTHMTPIPSVPTTYPYTIPPVTLDPIDPAPIEYTRVALGGTFDHLHPGHKILLTTALWISQNTSIGVVVFSGPITKRGARWMETIDVRMEGVRDFTGRMRSAGNVDVFELEDAFGPTTTDADIQAVVASLETLKGCEKINVIRGEKGLEPLDIVIIDVLGRESGELGDEEIGDKVSSSWLREWLEAHDGVKW